MADKEKEQTSADEGGPGDVEQAGETTAASAIKGPADETPVGEGTRVEVEGDS